MSRRLLLLVFLALAFLGVDRVASASVESRAEVACCACDEDECGVHDCCTPDGCACAPSHAAAPVAPFAAPLASTFTAGGTRWALIAEQRARDRDTAPPTRPPIG